MIPVIICGGVGTKMWPLSTPSTPKHFLPLINSESLFQINWRILRKRYSPEQIYLQTNASQAKIAHSQVPEIDLKNIFIETETRNQGPATGLAAAYLIRLGKGDEPYMIIQADDLRIPEDAIFDFMELAGKHTKETGKYVTSGFAPKWFQSGVDYLLKGNLVSKEAGVKIYDIADFVDRSDTERIKEHLGKGDLLMHTNHTCMTPNGLFAMYKKYRPEWYEPLMEIVNGATVSETYPKLPKGQIEEVTRIAHKNGESLVIENTFEWLDFGTWESLSKYYDEKEIFPPSGGTVEIEGNTNFLWSESGKIIATIGMENIIVIESPNGILITKKENSGKVGQIVERINSGDL
jgi:mannose-1-phosphate guanylyltransferase